MNHHDKSKASNNDDRKSSKGISEDLSKSRTEDQNQNHNTKKVSLGPNTKR